MFNSTKPSEEICGVTTSVMPVLIFSVAVLAEPAAPPVPVLITVPVDGSLTRRIVKLWIVAATLFMVMTRGRLMILALPSSSRAVKRVVRVVAPLSEPRERPIDEPVPGPKPVKPVGTEKSERNGTGSRGVPLADGGAEPKPRPLPFRPTVPGKVRPVGFPV